jgi:type IV pilus assembly protein PilA
MKKQKGERIMKSTRSNQGFTLVELLVVMVIIAILAAVATPIYLYNTQRAKASEAVAAMSQIRQALRDNKANGGSPAYFSIAGSGNGVIQNAINAATPGVAVDTGVAHYFSNGAFSVTVPPGTDTDFTAPANPVDFLIVANGSTTATVKTAKNQDCSAVSSFCATNASEVSSYVLKMDNAGRILVSYDGGTTFAAY